MFIIPERGIRCKGPSVAMSVVLTTSPQLQVLHLSIGYNRNILITLSYADLSEAIDVYSDWIDACEKANEPASIERGEDDDLGT